MRKINPLAAIIVFNILVFIYQVMIEIFTTIYSIEGIQLDKAQFQIISILTGTGFTTSESELMLLTKRRRKITELMMLFSYIFNISIVSTLVNIIISSAGPAINELIIGIVLTIINFLIIALLNKSTKVKSKLENFIKKIATNVRKKRKNPISVYDTLGDKVIAEINVLKINNNMNNINTEKLKEKYDIQVLVIKRGEQVISSIEPNITINYNDIVIVFGKMRNIKKIFVKEKSRK